MARDNRASGLNGGVSGHSPSAWAAARAAFLLAVVLTCGWRVSLGAEAELKPDEPAAKAKDAHWVHEDTLGEPVTFAYHRVELKHCIILTTCPAEKLVPIIQYPDKLFEAIVKILGPAMPKGTDPDGPVLKPKLVIRFFCEREEFQKFSRSHRPMFADFGGYATNKQIILWRQKTLYLNIKLLAHEMLHGILSRSIKDAPWWLHEGLARDFASFKFGTNSFTCSPFLERETKRMLDACRDGTWVPLAELLTLKPENVYIVKEGDDPEKAQLHRRLLYAEVWALVYYSRRDRTWKGRNALAQYLTKLRAGYTSVGAFREVFGTNVAEFERDWVSTMQRWYKEHGAR